MQVAVNGVAIKLIGDAGGALFEIFQVVRAPPVLQVAFAIEFAAVVVEAVSDYVSNDGTNSAVVHRVIGVRVVEGRLHNAGGKDDLIHAAVVVDVHGRGRPTQFGAVHRPAKFVQAAREIEFR